MTHQLLYNQFVVTLRALIQKVTTLQRGKFLRSECPVQETG
jgi:hypothetical protein